METEISSTAVALLIITVLSAVLTGSSIQWVFDQGGLQLSKFERKISWDDSNQQYYFIVTVAALTSLIQTVTCFVNTLLVAAERPNAWFASYIVLNWVFMTHSSVMLLSLKLSRTDYTDPVRAWKRLLWINVVMFPISLFICVYWTMAHASASASDSDFLDGMTAILEPLQISIWGMLEFVLSSAFIVKMWEFRWTKVERHGVFVLILVAACDVTTVLLNLFLGDLESTCVKGFVYCLRIRLEISVLNAICDFVRKRNYRVTSTEQQDEVVNMDAFEEGSRTNSCWDDHQEMDAATDKGAATKVTFDMSPYSTPSQRFQNASLGCVCMSSITLSDVEVMPTLIEEGSSRSTTEKPKLPDRPPMVPRRSADEHTENSFSSSESNDDLDDDELDEREECNFASSSVQLTRNLSCCRYPPAQSFHARRSSLDSIPLKPLRISSQATNTDFDESAADSDDHVDTEAREGVTMQAEVPSFLLQRVSSYGDEAQRN